MKNKKNIEQSIIGYIGEQLLFANKEGRIFVRTSVNSKFEIQSHFYVIINIHEHVFETLKEAIYFLSLEEEER